MIFKKVESHTKKTSSKNPFNSVGLKIFIIFFLCNLVLIMSVGYISYNKSASIIQKKQAVAAEQTITQVSSKLDLIFGSLENMTLGFMSDSTFLSNVSALWGSGTDDLARVTASQALLAKLVGQTEGNLGIDNMYMLPVNPKLLVITTDGQYRKEVNFRQQDWFNRIKQAQGAVVWLETKNNGYLGTPQATFAVGRIIQTASGEQFVLLASVDESILNDALSQIKFGQTGQLVILNKANVLLSQSNGQLAEAVYHIPNIVLGGALSGNKTIDVDGVKQLVVYHKMASSGWTIEASAPVSELVKETKGIWTITLWVALIAALISCIVGLLMARMIGKPLASMRNLMKEGEKGNLTVRTNFRMKDEIGQLGTSFDQMMEQINHLVQQTSHSAQEVLTTAGELLNSSMQTETSAREIAVATEEIANGSTSLAMEAERGNHLTGEIGMQLNNVVETNAVMERSANQVQQASKLGIQYMIELSNKTGSTEEMTRSMVAKVDRLKDSTSSIQKIMDVLNQMTKQTNILSLNATIEAARAGVAGKGFMVVADEIRKLAEQSKHSIGIVGDIIVTIQKEIDETVAVLSKAYPIFQEQIQSVKKAEVIFDQVEQEMGGFVGQLTKVTGSIQLLDESQHVLSEAMTNVSAVSQQSSATSEEVASLSSEQLNVSQGLVKLSVKLEELSNSLQNSLSSFRY